MTCKAFIVLPQVLIVIVREMQAANAGLLVCPAGRTHFSSQRCRKARLLGLYSGYSCPTWYSTSLYSTSYLAVWNSTTYLSSNASDLKRNYYSTAVTDNTWLFWSRDHREMSNMAARTNSSIWTIKMLNKKSDVIYLLRKLGDVFMIH